MTGASSKLLEAVEAIERNLLGDVCPHAGTGWRENIISAVATIRAEAERMERAPEACVTCGSDAHHSQWGDACPQ